MNQYFSERQFLFCHQDASNNRLGRNEVNTKDKVNS